MATYDIQGPLLEACACGAPCPCWIGEDPHGGNCDTFLAQRAVTLGMRHGVFCVGCCWAMMLLMFAVGGVNLGWMLPLGTVMFVEKAVAWGRWITAPAGALLALWGLALPLKIPWIPPPF